LVLRLRHEPTDEVMERINDEYGDLVVDGRFERITATDEEIEDDDVPELARIRFHFTRRNLGRLRALIDTLNDTVPAPPAA
ncbi:MAG TPA: cytochrome D ubiquinol oxidase subunit II, partial [Acidimicrobiia bacterium]|nr:cytochrome D ubiquinol oxidase subunit II [Acidimicrobiia bacterium]